MAIQKVKPYWHDKDYEPPLYPKKNDYKGTPRKRLTKAEKEQKALRETPFPWERK